MKVKNLFFNVAAVLLSSLLISCASAPEMSAEEERFSAGGEVASATSSVPASKEEAVAKETAAPSTMNEATETKSTVPVDPGISETASSPSHSLESLSETKPEPTLVTTASESKASEILAEAKASVEALPLSGEMNPNPKAEEKISTPSSVATIDSSLMAPSMNEPILAMPTLDTPKKSKKNKQKGTTVHTSETKPQAKAPLVAVAQAVDTHVAKAVVTNQVSVVEKEGAKLNRFYFLRPGDHTEKVSELLYGNRAMADKLVKWNGGVQNWLPGNRIVYNSPVVKNDTTFLSFYEEGQVTLKEHRVQKGDSLKTLAAKFYGDVRCWSELAYINQMTTATPAVSEGVVLKFAPERLVATTVQAKANTPAVDAVDVDEDPFVAADKERTLAQVKQKSEKSLASANLGAFIVNNLFLVVTVTLVLGLVVFMVKRRDKDPMEF